VSPDAEKKKKIPEKVAHSLWIPTYLSWRGSNPTRRKRYPGGVRTSFPSRCFVPNRRWPSGSLPSSYPALTLLGLGSPSFGEPSFNKLSVKPCVTVNVSYIQHRNPSTGRRHRGRGFLEIDLMGLLSIALHPEAEGSKLQAKAGCSPGGSEPKAR